MIEHPDHTGMSANPNAPWNAPDAYEGDHTCDECGRVEWDYGIDGETCAENLRDEDGEWYVCEGILRAPHDD